jgi:hypothetical protein
VLWMPWVPWVPWVLWMIRLLSPGCIFALMKSQCNLEWPNAAVFRAEGLGIFYIAYELD